MITMSKATRIRRAVTCGFAVLLLTLAAGPAVGTETSPDDSSTNESSTNRSSSEERDEYTRLLEKANSAYNERNYEQALTKYTRAAQHSPTNAFPYLGIARSYFWMDRYSVAVHHYDLFLQVAGQQSNPPDRVTDQLKDSRSERKLASSRSEGEAWQRPEAQRRLVSALRDELDDGNAYTAGGGGAWALYEALLRTDYVAPNLARLRSRLARKLVDEVDRRLVPEDSGFIPERSLDDWKEDRQRLDAASSIPVNEPLAERIASRKRVISAGIDMLNGNHGRAAEQFSEAADEMTEWQFLRWLRIACLIRTERYEAAEEAIAASRDKPFVTSQITRYLDLMEGLIAQRRGEMERASEVFDRLMQGASSNPDAS